MIKVLWIDDECRDAQGELTDLGREFIEYAHNEGIEITSMSNYKDGLRAIEAQPSEWCAVILDIREQRATTDAADGYNDARHRLDLFHYEHKQSEPYVFTLSGEKQYQEGNSTIRKEQYASKRVYDKNGDDYKVLFNDIRKIEEVSDLYQLQEKYKDVLSAARNTLGEDAYTRLFSLMRPILIQNNNTNAKLLNEMRKYLEEFIIAKLKDMEYPPNDIKSLNDHSRYIGSQASVPEYVKRSVHSLVSITQSGSHGKIDDALTTDEDVRSGRAPYLLKSCLFELFNIIYWMKTVCNY